MSESTMIHISYLPSGYMIQTKRKQDEVYITFYVHTEWIQDSLYKECKCICDNFIEVVPKKFLFRCTNS